jgi:energy-coupling factor transport system permease protein
MFLYKRLASPLHATRAGVAVGWAAALAVADLATEDPLVLATLALAIALAGAAAGVGAPLLRALRPAAAMGVPIVLVNLLVARQGLTVFARLGDLGPFGQGDLTVEALAYGAVIALKVALLPLIATVAALSVDPDELLRGMRRLSFRSALTVSLATRMMGVLAADSQRLAEAQRTRPVSSGVTARGRTPQRLALLGAVVGSSLDRAMDVAATLELRGLALVRARAMTARRRWSRHDLAFGAATVGVLALSAGGRLAGADAFVAYPALRCAAGPATFALCLGLLALVLAPFADRRGIAP